MPKMHYKRAIMSDKEVERKVAMLAKCREFVPSVVPIVTKPLVLPKPTPSVPSVPSVPSESSITQYLPAKIITFN
jgi:hypothetical protein